METVDIKLNSLPEDFDINAFVQSHTEDAIYILKGRDYEFGSNRTKLSNDYRIGILEIHVGKNAPLAVFNGHFLYDYDFVKWIGMTKMNIL